MQTFHKNLELTHDAFQVFSSIFLTRYPSVYVCVKDADASMFETQACFTHIFWAAYL